MKNTFKIMETNCNYMILLNDYIFDRNISFEARGLCACIQFLIKTHDYISKDELINMSSDNTETFNSAWEELINSGYIEIVKNNY